MRILLSGVAAWAASVAAVAGAALPAPASLKLVCPDSYLPGVPVLVRVELWKEDGSVARQVWDSVASLVADPAQVTLAPTQVVLRNGRGSALVRVTSGSGDFTLAAAAEGLTGSRLLKDLTGQQVASVSGDVPAGVTEWSGVIHVTGPLNVPAGRTLRLLPGTLVLLNGVVTAEGQPGECTSLSATPTKCGTSITVHGTLESLGTEDQPVTITAWDRTRAWGQIDHQSSAPSVYQHTFITRGGNSPRGGHTSTGPTLRATNSRLSFESCTISDTAGKTMLADGSDLQFHDCILSRSTMGPEISRTALRFERCHVLDMHQLVSTPDDNDGIYLHDQMAGQVITLTGSVFASGDDDGIDTLGSTITVGDCIIRDWNNPNEDAKGISVFSGEVTVRDCLIINNKEGIAAKGQATGAVLRVDRTTIAQAAVGLHAYDKYNVPALKILLYVSNSIVRATDAVLTDDYPVADTQIRYSNVSEAWAGAGNITIPPLFVDEAGHDFHLQAESPCIDAGDPASSPDPDGTRADMGVYFTPHSAVPRFTRGRVNGDAVIDLSDTVALLFHLFAARALPCEESADANDDGRLDVSDAIFLLEFTFRGAAAPPAPQGSCGTDPTVDSLGCASPVCP